LFTRNQDFPSGRARRDLNWRPSIPVDQAIRQTARWLRESCSTSTAVD
jgi:nucleoside-diphosphate-sugar epimerase